MKPPPGILFDSNSSFFMNIHIINATVQSPHGSVFHHFYVIIIIIIILITVGFQTLSCFSLYPYYIYMGAK